MDKIEFLVSTGLSFYSPEDGFRCPDMLLDKTWNYRVLVEPNSAICLQLGDKPIQNAVSGDVLLTDVGGISICFGDALRACLGKWLPMPFCLKTNDKSLPTKSVDWARIMLTRPALQLDENVFKYAIAVDTTVNESPDAVGNKLGTGLLPEDVGSTFEIDCGNTHFFQTPAMLNWIRTALRDVPVTADEGVPANAISLATFFTLVDGLKQSEMIPDITFLSPEGEDIDVNLILDLGNSRACGILAEERNDTDVRLDDCCKLEIRNLKDPAQSYTEPFSTSFKFCPPLFDGEDYKIPSVSSRFVWPGVVRLGQEAAEMEPLDIGDTGMSSPKRYLWDQKQRPLPWYFNVMDDGIGKKLSGSVLGCLNDDGYFQGEDANLSFVHCYPASSMMTFAMVEILCHTYAQINSFSYRKSRGQRQTVRRLKNIVLTVPNGMSMTEKNVYLKRIQSAIDMYFFTTNKNTALKPKVHLDMDEASAIQLTYLYGEITNHFMGDTRAAISTLGRNRQLENGEYADVLRIASIDIGGGTSDLMISEYFNSAEHTIEQRSIFSEGFSVAGDEIAKRIIEKLILKRVFNWAKEKKEDINWDDFRNLFGPGHGGHDGDLNRFISMKAEMCRQIWIPMSMRYLEFAEMDSEDPNIELTFDRFFPDRMPGSNVLDFFSEQMRSLFGVDMTLSEIPWRISRAATNNVISNVLDNVLRIYSEVISLFSCDVLVLGGKPSSLPIIRDILIKYMPVRPSGIICLKGYPIGDWYPFARRCGGIADPKTTCVVGAAVWLFAEKLKRLESLSIRSENEMVKQRECFIGTFIKDTMTMNSVLFPAPSGNVTRINMSRSQMLGVRRIDSNLCMVNPLWEIVLDRTKLKGNGPFTLTLSQNGTNKEVIEVKEIFDENNRKDDKNAVSLNLRTMVSDQYWLDTGCFEL